MKAAKVAHDLRLAGYAATRESADCVTVRVDMGDLFRVADNIRVEGWQSVGEFDASTGACRVVLRAPDCGGVPNRPLAR